MNLNQLSRLKVQHVEGARHRRLMWIKAKKALHNTPADCPTLESKRRFVVYWWCKFWEYQKEIKEIVRDG